MSNLLIFEKFQNWQFPELRKSLKFQKNRHTNRNFTNFKKNSRNSKKSKVLLCLKTRNNCKEFHKFLGSQKIAEYFSNQIVRIAKISKLLRLQKNCNHYPNCRKFRKFQKIAKISKIVQICLVAINC